MRRLLIIALGVFAVVGCDDDDAGLAGPGQAGVSIFTQADRIGLPAINTVFIPSSSKDAYNLGAPVNDVADFGQFLVDFGVNVTGRTPPEAAALRDLLLPDILPIDLTQPSGFLNGRTLEDDVVTVELMLLFSTNTDLNDDHVDANDKAFLTVFPYLAEPFTQ